MTNVDGEPGAGNPGADTRHRSGKKLLEKAHKHALEHAVVELYKEGVISTGTGAEVVSMPIYDFIQFLGRHQVSIFDHTLEDLQQDIQAARATHDEVRVVNRRNALIT